VDAAFAVARRDAVDGVVALTVVGGLDKVSGDILSTMTSDSLGRDVDELVVDLAQVTWLDQAGVDALVLGQETALRAGCRYRVANPSGVVELILETNDRAGRLHVSAGG
jgi:anti-anti-sigma regulatory factor